MSFKPSLKALNPLIGLRQGLFSDTYDLEIPSFNLISTVLTCTAVEKLRIVTLGVSGGGSLTGLFRDARRFPSTRWYTVPGATRTALGFGICPSFKGDSLSPHAKPLKSRFALFASLQAVRRGCCHLTAHHMSSSTCPLPPPSFTPLFPPPSGGRHGRAGRRALGRGARYSAGGGEAHPGPGEVLPLPDFPYRRLRIQGGQGRGGLKIQVH